MMIKRAAFTLIELMISITILSIMMLFLYKSYASLNISNDNLKHETQTIQSIQKIKKVVYLDFLTAINDTNSSISIVSRDKKEDFVTLQSSHSIHRRFNPYVTYMVKEKKLYRLESLKKFLEYQLPSDGEFDLDCMGEVNSFRVYKSSDATKKLYFVHVDFKTKNDLLLKIKLFNE